jgi:hypothetical protein
VNTWSNLYAIFSGAYLAWWMWKDRKLGGASNVMKSKWWMGDVYLFCVIFLGLGSMWLHASMSKWVSWFDNFSMYAFTGFLVFYTLDRWLSKLGKSVEVRTRYFWIGYPLTASGFTLIGALTGLPSEILIGTLIGIYLWLEHQAGFIWDTAPKWFWLAGLGSFGAAAAFRSASQTGGPMCWPDSVFQAHGLLWHTLSGLMALFLYFYWRRDKGGLGSLPPGYQ